MAFSIIFYLFIFLLSSFFAYCVQYGRKKDEGIFRFIVFLIFFLPAAFRYGIGTDYAQYAIHFTWPIESITFEIGVKGIYYICQTFFNSPQSFFVVTSFLTYFPLCFFLKKKFFFHLIFFYNLGFCYLDSYNIIRQSMAFVFLICSIQFLLDKSIKKAFLFCLIACLCHKSSYFFVFLLFMAFIKLDTVIRFLLFIVFFVFVFVVDLQSFVSFILTPLFPQYVTSYLISKFIYEGTGIAVIMKMFFPMYMFLKSKTLKDNFISNLTFFYLLLSTVLLKMPVLGRLGQVFFVIPMFLSIYLFNQKSKYKMVLYYFFVLIYLIIFVKSLLSSGAGVIPYSSIFHIF